MKKIALILFYCGLLITAKSQEASVESSTFGVQAGVVGFWGHNEAKLSRTTVLRSEIGLAGGLFHNSFAKTVLYLAPVITLEPRWYYNLSARQRKGKRIDKNSANFVSISADYSAPSPVISTNKNLVVNPKITFIPTWGIKRHLGGNFMYEVGTGLGYGYFFETQKSDVMLKIHLRIGYSF